MKLRYLATAVLLLSLAQLARASEAVPFVNDDYTKALALAKTKNLPVFVEAWAPW